MSHEYAIVCDFDNSFGDFEEFWCAFQHFVIDAREFDNKWLNGFFGIDQTDKLVYNFVSVEFINCDFGNSFFVELTACGFYVEYAVNSLKV